MSMDITSSDKKIMKRNAKKFLSLCMFLDAASDSIFVYSFCCSWFHKFRADSVQCNDGVKESCMIVQEPLPQVLFFDQTCNPSAREVATRMVLWQCGHQMFMCSIGPRRGFALHSVCSTRGGTVPRSH